MTAYPADNPLLLSQGLVAFDRIRAEHVTPAIDRLLQEARDTIASLEQSRAEVTWDSFVEPLDTATERLSRAWKSIEHLNAVADSPELRAAYNANIPRVTDFWTGLAQSEMLLAKFKSLHSSPQFCTLSAARQRTVDNALRDFRLGGAELDKVHQQRFAQIQEQLAGLGQRFLENLLDATNAYALYIDDADQLGGMPADAVAAARQRAEQSNRKGYKLTLEMPCYLAVMQFAERRELRRTLYEAYAKRASETKRCDMRQHPQYCRYPAAAPRTGASARVLKLC